VPFSHPRRLSSAAAQELRIAILWELGLDEAANLDDAADDERR